MSAKRKSHVFRNRGRLCLLIQMLRQGSEEHPVRVIRQGQECKVLEAEIKMWFCTEAVYPMRQDISEKNRECFFQIPPQVEKT